jgi:hypothetical protein
VISGGGHMYHLDATNRNPLVRLQLFEFVYGLSQSNLNSKKNNINKENDNSNNDNNHNNNNNGNIICDKIFDINGVNLNFAGPPIELLIYTSASNLTLPDLKSILKLGVDLSNTLVDVRSLFETLVSASNDAALVEFLLQQSDFVDFFHRSPIIYEQLMSIAINNNQFNIVSLLVEKYKVPILKDVLHSACCRVDFVLSRYCIENKLADIDAVDDDGQSPLLISILKFQPFYNVKYLLDNGADITHVDKNGNGLLYFIFKHYCPQQAILLLDHLVEKYQFNLNTQQTPQQQSNSRHNLVQLSQEHPIFQFLKRFFAQPTPPSTFLLQTLLFRYKLDIDTLVTPHGHTALHFLVQISGDVGNEIVIEAYIQSLLTK